MDGIVVHAYKGEREHYRPVQSILTSSADPLEVARALQMETDCRAFYIADLDAIQGKGHNRKTISNLALRLDAELWVDAGVSHTRSAEPLVAAGADIVIVGSETLRGLDRLRAIGDSMPWEQVIFSLDMAGGRVLSRAEALVGAAPLEAMARVTEEGIERFILLTLDAVGSGSGPDLPLLKRAKRNFPHHTIIAGGGVKTPEHLQALSTAGVNGVLVATSLHKGWITSRDIASLT